MSLDASLDLYALKRSFERVNELIDLGAATADMRFLRTARRALLPLPVLDRPRPVTTDVFPPFRDRPARALSGRRVAVVATGGGGGALAMAGIARAFEEAHVRPNLIVGCSGSAIWGAMWAAGLSAQQIAGFSLAWRPQDYLDVQWLKLPRFALSALRGFSGLAKGDAIESLLDVRLRRLRVGDTPIPLKTIVYNMDLGRVEYFGTRETPELSIGKLVRTAIALPLFIEAVPFRDHFYVDGGIVELWPAQPVLEDDSFDHVFGANLMLPTGFEPTDITGWTDRRAGILAASRQLQQGYHLEMARRARDRLGDRLTLMDPIEPGELRGVSFYELFIDHEQWPRIMRQGYDAATRALEPFRRPARRPRAATG